MVLGACVPHTNSCEGDTAIQMNKYSQNGKAVPSPDNTLCLLVPQLQADCSGSPLSSASGDERCGN